jgi:carboxylesterase
MVYIHPKAEPFFLNGSREMALLFLHGFTASPSEVFPAAKKVHEISGCTVSGPLLPGHGSDPRFLNRLKWQDWFQAVEKEAVFLQAEYKKVYVAGLSMGGLLALHAAACMKDLRGIISINAPIFSRAPFLDFTSRIIARFQPYYPKKNLEELRELETKGRFAYDVMPGRAYLSMLQLKSLVIRELTELNLRVLILQSRQDDVVNPGSGSFLTSQVKGARLVELQESGHIATMGPEVGLIAQEIGSFINE